MHEGNELAQSVFQLRRMARLLAGAQEGGDAVVEATLETLADGEVLGADPRVALYRMFCRFWNGPLGQQVRALATPKPSDRALQQRLLALTPRSRQAFMLLALEGFTLEAAAEILEQSHDEVTALVETARREVVDQLATDILIRGRAAHCRRSQAVDAGSGSPRHRGRANAPRGARRGQGAAPRPHSRGHPVG